tara:strand:+ start:1243 stop:1461 length:219 start_codon:yes stop_codon:yes gene_type:complete
MRKEMIMALTNHFHGEIGKHKMNVEVFLSNPVGVGEHIDIMETVSLELGKIAEFEDKLMILEQYFKQEPPKI